MLIPEFKLKQDDSYVIVQIKVPYIKVTACEFYIETNSFKFYLKPYLLSLNFEEALKEADEPAKAVYYHDKYVLEVSLQKLKPGQYFQNLNLISNILVNKKGKEKARTTLVEVVGENPKVVESQNHEVSPFNYGFCYNYHDVFDKLEEQAIQLFAFHPANVAIPQRYDLSWKVVYEDFDENSYKFDKFSNFEQIDEVVGCKLYSKCIESLQQCYFGDEPLSFEKFKAQLKLPSKELLIGKGDEEGICKQIISLVFCYLYELICLRGEMGVESAKTINKTSVIFNCNTLYQSKISIENVVYDCCRRCITYSLYKHLEICEKVQSVMHRDLNQNSIRAIILNLRELMEKSEPRYLLNRIYMDDYCAFVLQDRDTNLMEKLLREAGKVEVKEERLDLDIVAEEMNSIMEIDNENITNDLEKMLDLD